MNRSVATWLGVAVTTAVVAFVVWTRLQVPSEAPVQVIKPPVHRSARVEDRLSQLRAEWSSRAERTTQGEIRERKAPPAQMAPPPTAAGPVEAPPETDADLDAEAGPLEKALAQEEPDFDALKQVAVTDPDPENRLTAVMLLGTVENPAAVSVLAQTVKDADTDVRLMSVQALSDFTDADSVAAVTAAMSDPSPEVRFEALSVLADIGGEGTRAALQQALNDPDEDVRALAQGLLSMDDLRPNNGATPAHPAANE